MTQKERLLNTLAGRAVDGAPFICPGGMMTMIVTDVMDAVETFWPEAHSDPAKMAELTLGANRLSGIENLGLPFCMTVEAEAMGAAVDLGGKNSEPRVTAYVMDSLAQQDRLGFIDVTRGRAKVCAEAIGMLKEKAPDVPIIANLSGPVSLATSLVDPLLYYRAMRRDKQAAHALNGRAVENALALGDALVEEFHFKIAYQIPLVEELEPVVIGKLTNNYCLDIFAGENGHQLFDTLWWDRQ